MSDSASDVAEADDLIQSLQTRVALLERLIDEFPAQLIAEREMAQVSADEIDGAVDRIEQVSADIARAKARAKRHKQEMKKWWAWHAQLSDEERAEQAIQIERESNRRGAAIARHEADITALEADKLAAIEEYNRLIELHGAQQSADDPRLESMNRELESTRQALREAINGR